MIQHKNGVYFLFYYLKFWPIAKKVFRKNPSLLIRLQTYKCVERRLHLPREHNLRFTNKMAVFQIATKHDAVTEGRGAGAGVRGRIPHCILFAATYVTF